MDTVIHTDKLEKRFGNICAVNKVSLHVKKGEIYGFLGLNGAGKTTTIRLLLGMINPTSGTAYFYGKKINSRDHDLWKKVGYLVETPYSYPNLTVEENLEIIRRLRSIENPKVVDEIISKLQLDSYKNRKVKYLSLGNTQRLGLAKALIHNPDILLLDEPSNGLDPAGIVEIRELLLDMALNHGVTIFLSSHILGEISKIAGKIGIIHKGNLVQELEIKEIDRLRRKSLLVNANNRDFAKRIIEEKGYSVNVSDQGDLVIYDEKALMKPELISALLSSRGYPPTLLVKKEEDLESYFFRVIGIDGGGSE